MLLLYHGENKVQIDVDVCFEQNLHASVPFMLQTLWNNSMHVDMSLYLYTLYLGWDNHCCVLNKGPANSFLVIDPTMDRTPLKANTIIITSLRDTI